MQLLFRISQGYLVCFTLFLLAVLIQLSGRWDKGVIEPGVCRILYALLAAYLCIPWWASSEVFTQKLFWQLLYAAILGFAVFFGGMLVFLAAFPCCVSKADGTEAILIVPGAPVYQGRPTPNLICRAKGAQSWLVQHPKCIAVLSGGNGKPLSEAECMASLILDISPQKLLLEQRSTTTKENFQFSSELMLQNGYSKSQPVAVTTNRFHIYRLRRYPKQAGFTDIRFLVLPTPKKSALVWYFREAVAIIRSWFPGV